MSYTHTLLAFKFDGMCEDALVKVTHLTTSEAPKQQERLAMTQVPVDRVKNFSVNNRSTQLGNVLTTRTRPVDCVKNFSVNNRSTQLVIALTTHTRRARVSCVAASQRNRLEANVVCIFGMVRNN